jgi:hypothetical protein
MMAFRAPGPRWPHGRFPGTGRAAEVRRRQRGVLPQPGAVPSPAQMSTAARSRAVVSAECCRSTEPCRALVRSTPRTAAALRGPHENPPRSARPAVAGTPATLGIRAADLGGTDNAGSPTRAVRCPGLPQRPIAVKPSHLTSNLPWPRGRPVAAGWLGCAWCTAWNRAATQCQTQDEPRRPGKPS